MNYNAETIATAIETVSFDADPQITVSAFGRWRHCVLVTPHNST